jgi:hypothetical protein
LRSERAIVALINADAAFAERHRAGPVPPSYTMGLPRGCACRPAVWRWPTGSCDATPRCGPHSWPHAPTTPVVVIRRGEASRDARPASPSEPTASHPREIAGRLSLPEQNLGPARWAHMDDHDAWLHPTNILLIKSHMVGTCLGILKVRPQPFAADAEQAPAYTSEGSCSAHLTVKWGRARAEQRSLPRAWARGGTAGGQWPPR